MLQHNITALIESTRSKRTKETGPVLIVIPTTKRRAATQHYCLEEKHRISHGVLVIREKLAEKVKPAKEAGLVLIVIATTKSLENVMEMIEKDLLELAYN